MQVEVLFFAVVKERLGRDRAVLDLPAAATVALALEHLMAGHPALDPLLPRVQIAVNRKMVGRDHRLADGDEMALIPPVAGGAGARRINLSPEPLSLDEVVAAVRDPDHGGIATFTGCVRRQGSIKNVTHLQYEAYAPMAIDVMTAVANEIEQQWPGVRLAIHHRTGVLVVGEPAVVIAASAPHRAEAFAACRAAIDQIKQRAPIWKKEFGEAGAVWVENHC